MTALLMIVGVFAVSIVGIIWKGYVLSILWAWFAVPVFGLPALGIAAAIGVALVISFLTHQYVYTEDERGPAAKFGAMFGAAFLYPLIVLTTGWIVKGFM